MNAMPFAPIPAAFTLLLCRAPRAIHAIKQFGRMKRATQKTARDTQTEVST
ncbi:hypothetical protein [Paraburkholderia sp. UYCP14C]|uniref:hypothetical protein n=1 Tax=Paraburkholderia sp. UYCP14C TaxID=2511130 RepID=UPI001459FFAD|nr:hypothetical protein [Paraburkholderia sp. UYCP14C]